MKKNVIEIKKLVKYYDKVKGVDAIDLEVKEGEIFGFIGPNGAGKSTTIRCIMNMINKTSGEIFINGEYIDDSDYKMKEEIGYLPSEIHLYDDLTVKEMLEYNASFYKKNCKKEMNELVKIFELDIKKKVDDLSLGNGKKLGIVLALMHDPKIIILDEPTSGLDPLMQEKFYEILLKKKKEGKTIFFSSHNLSEVKRLCERVAIIKDGEIIAINDTDKLSDAHFCIVKVYSSDKSALLKRIKGKIVEESDNYFKIMFQGETSELIKILNEYPIDKLFIEEPSIEEIFMHYYVKE